MCFRRMLNSCILLLQIAAGFANSIPDSTSSGSMPSGGLDVQRLREELAFCNLKLVRWKEGIAQARNVSVPIYFTLFSSIFKLGSLSKVKMV
jgi:hypothetical protein